MAGDVVGVRHVADEDCETLLGYLVLDNKTSVRTPRGSQLKGRTLVCSGTSG